MILHTRLPAIFGAQAMCLAPWLILLHPARAGDAALIAHEQMHAEQMREVGGAVQFWLRYLLCRDCRQRFEVEAYRVQIAHGASIEGCARNLVAHYRLRIDLPTARRLLS